MEKKRIVFEVVFFINEENIKQDPNFIQNLATKDELERKVLETISEEVYPSEVEKITVRIWETIGFSLPSKL